MGRDLGTYYLRVELKDGRGWIDQWNTSGRYTNGSATQSPLSAIRIQPTWDSEQDVFRTMEYMYMEGNYSCDCNKMLFWLRSQQMDDDVETPCGDTMTIQRLTAIRPDGSEHVLFLDPELGDKQVPDQDEEGAETKPPEP